MSVQNVGGDIFVVHTKQVTLAANLADKSLVTVRGAAVTSAAAGVYGVLVKDGASGDLAAVKVPPSIVEVIATGTVTEGNMVEALQGTVYANIAGVSTATTSAGVKDLASGYPIGKALSTSDVNGTVLVALIVNQVKSA